MALIDAELQRRRLGWRQGLQRVVSIFQLEWVREFVYGGDLSKDASILSSPLQRQHGLALSSEVRTTPLIKAGQEQERNEDEAIRMSCVWLQIPAWSKDGLTVGLTVAHIPPVEHAPEEVSLFQGGWHFARFVVDSASADFICLIERPEKDELDIEVYHRGSSKTGLTAYFTFCASALREVVLDDEQRPHMYSFCMPLKMSSVACYSRPCPTCKTAPTFPCTCRANFAAPSHPLDFSHMPNNFSTIVGDYSGPADVEFFHGGQLVTTMGMYIECHYVSFAPRGTYDVLSSWGMTNRLSQLQVCLEKLRMPQGNGQIEAPQQDEQQYSQVGHVHIERECEDEEGDEHEYYDNNVYQARVVHSSCEGDSYGEQIIYVQGAGRAEGPIYNQSDVYAQGNTYEEGAAYNEPVIGKEGNSYEAGSQETVCASYDESTPCMDNTSAGQGTPCVECSPYFEHDMYLQNAQSAPTVYSNIAAGVISGSNLNETGPGVRISESELSLEQSDSRSPIPIIIPISRYSDYNRGVPLTDALVPQQFQMAAPLGVVHENATEATHRGNYSHSAVHEGASEAVHKGNYGTIDNNYVAPVTPAANISNNTNGGLSAARVAPMAINIVNNESLSRPISKAVPIAPLPQAVNMTTASSTDVMTEAEKKEYERTLKKREAAARSNLRRKLKNEERKAQQQRERAG